MFTMNSNLFYLFKNLTLHMTRSTFDKNIIMHLVESILLLTKEHSKGSHSTNGFQSDNNDSQCVGHSSDGHWKQFR